MDSLIIEHGLGTNPPMSQLVHFAQFDFKSRWA